MLLDGTPASRKIAAAYSEVTTGHGFGEALRAKAGAALADGGSGIATLTATLRQVGEQVADEVRVASEDAACKAAEGGGRCSARCNYNSWTKRLFAARGFRKTDCDPMLHARDGLFHEATGLRKTLLQACYEGKSRREVWDAVVRRCRRQAHRAGRAAAWAMQTQTRRAVLEAETILLQPVESATRLQRVWRMVRGQRASVKLDAACSRATPCPDAVSSAMRMTPRESLARSGNSWSLG